MVSELSLFDPLVKDAIVVSAILATVCAVVGVFVVLRGISFIGDGLSHASVAGSGIALALGVPPIVGAMASSILITAGLSLVGGSGALKDDARLSVLFTGSMALGFVVLSGAPQGMQPITGLLFGSLIPVASGDLLMSAGAAAVILGVVWYFRRQLVLVSVDEEFSAVSGVGPRRYLFLLDVLTACAVVLTSRIVGVLLVSSLLVIPAAIALMSVRDVALAFPVAVLVGLFVSFCGVLASLSWDTPPGATIALFSAFLFLVVVGYNKCRTRT